MLAIPILYVVLLAALVARPIILAIKWEELYWGGTRNFLDDTVTTSLRDLFGFYIVERVGFWLAIAVCIILAMCAYLVIFKVIKSRGRNAVFLIPVFILAWCVLGVNLQFYILHSPLVIYRTALYFYPLCVLTMFSALYFYRDSIAGQLASGGVTLVLLVSLLAQLNTDVIREWWFDGDNKKVLADIMAKNRNKKVRLYTFELGSNSFNYYISSRYRDSFHDVPRIPETERDSSRMSAFDYIYTANDFPVTIPPQYKLISRYCNGGTALYGR